jgi:hypothetical protein
MLPDIIADPNEAARLTYIDSDRKSPTYGQAVTLECAALSEALTAWSNLSRPNRDGAHIRTAGDRRLNAGDLKKLHRQRVA